MELDIKGEKDFVDFHKLVTCALITMYKILVFVAFLFYLVNSEYTEDCPFESGFFDGKNGKCYYVGIGNNAMTQYEAKKYCESKNGTLLAPKSLPRGLKYKLSRYASLIGVKEWWISPQCYELLLLRKNEYGFEEKYPYIQGCSSTNRLKRKPICEKLYP